MNRELSGSLGFVCLIGGVLFPMLLLVLSSMLGSGSSDILTGVARTVVLVTFIFFLAGVLGVYLAQQDALGTLGKAAAATFAAGLVLTVIEGALSATSIVLPVDIPVGQAAFALVALGAISFGIATARADVLVHGRSGGLLLAAALPLTFVGGIILNIVGIQSAVISALIIGVPFGAAWVVLGLDLLTVSDYQEVGEQPGPS